MTTPLNRLAVYCGSASPEDQRYVELAYEVGKTLAERNIGVVYGGGRLGLMGAVAGAALAAGGEVIGVIPRGLATAEVAHDRLSALHVVESMHERKALMADLSDGFVALPGGFGTMDEFHEILTWRQLQIHDKPIGLLNVAGYYDPLLALYDRMEADGFLRASTRALFVAAPTIAELLERFA